ncbi:aromatic ring-hydroxylating oxygenase subunit alpha [Portibacter marinus]|uniref:aromatic ring-hydroxylating oxygenase subunit alpha n=1 Tax=Portibacter marinus TaxID=2898660 RepID=UPI001F211A7D|nr:SRPBCC family protein [Portibacter marinus]
MKKFYIDPDIRKASTLPACFYHDAEIFDLLLSEVLVKSWQWIGSSSDLLPLTHYAYPFELHNEPLLLIKPANEDIVCLSNVCTHRGNILVHHPGKLRQLKCMYHGRRFEMNGQFKFMPEFQEAEQFPRPCDDLRDFSLGQWFSHLFVSLEPAIDFSQIVEVLNERVGHLPIDLHKLSKNHSKEYIVNSHWALYCDNYLEGFHIPFVHDDLNDVLDYGQYETILYDHAVLQVGYTDDSENVFDLPEEHLDYGRNVAAYYYWIFPNIMFNFYPWGLSVNVVKPISINRTKVSFISYIFDDSKVEEGAGAALDKVEREDEFVVENVHRGLRSKYYQAGRFSPTREKGVHHFHRLLAKYMNKVMEE